MRITCSDKKISNEIMEKVVDNNFYFMDILINSLKNCKDNIITYKLIKVLRECISFNIENTKSLHNEETNEVLRKWKDNLIIAQLIKLDTVKILLQILMSMQHLQNDLYEQIILETSWILRKIASADKNFVTKMISANTAKLFHEFLKLYYNKNKILFSILILIKYLIKNASMGQFLIEDGVALTLAKIIIYLDYNPCLKLFILMDCLKFLTKNKIFCVRFIEVGMINLLIRIFENWKKFEGQLCLKISNYALITLQHLTKIKIGKKSIRSEKGLELLYNFCLTCPEDKIYDHILLGVCKIINQCLQKRYLSVPAISPIQFKLPDEISMNLKSKQNVSGININVKNKKNHSRDQLSNDFSQKEKNGNHNRDNLIEIKKSNSKTIDNLLSKNINLQRLDDDISRYRAFFREFDNSHLPNSKLKLQLLKKEDLTVYSEFNILKLKLNYLKNTKIHENISRENIYLSIANSVKSIIPFFKIAYPDLTCTQILEDTEPLNIKNRNVCRNKLLSCIDRAVHPHNEAQRIVYNLDDLISNFSRNNETIKILKNCDKKKINIKCRDAEHLFFESRFESGNLRKATQIGPREYDLILTPDVNCSSQHQWFYFEVSNMEANYLYTFNILNYEKPNSQFNFGMKPIIFSVIEALNGRSGWVRTGMDICYYKNCYYRPDGEKNYFTITFSLIFPHSYDICYLAYHFPYTYSYLITSIDKWLYDVDYTLVYFRVDKLCDTLNGNESPLITITAPDSYKNPIHKRKIIFLTSRVHPGESNASWIMHGTLETLLGNSIYVSSLRNDYVFKIIPMINVEGVINGW